MWFTWGMAANSTTHTKTKPLHTTLLGVPVVMFETRKDQAGPAGERVTAIYWRADGVRDNVEYRRGDLVLRHVQGDGRKLGFREYDRTIEHDVADLVEVSILFGDYTERRLG